MTIVEKILDNWIVSENRIITPIENKDNVFIINNKYILKSTTNATFLRNNINIPKILSAYDVPVCNTIKTITNEDYITIDSTFYYLYTKLEGYHINGLLPLNNTEIPFMLGVEIGKLHKALKNCSNSIQPNNHDMYNEIIENYLPTIKSNSNNNFPIDLAYNNLTNFKYLYYKIPRQIIHRDVHFGNILIDKDILTGWLDFDEVQINVRIFDLCNMARSFLIENWRNNKSVEPWLKIFRALINGYNSICPLTEEEILIFPLMMIYLEIGFISFYYDINKFDNAQTSIGLLNWLFKNLH